MTKTIPVPNAVLIAILIHFILFLPISAMIFSFVEVKHSRVTQKPCLFARSVCGSRRPPDIEWSHAENLSLIVRMKRSLPVAGKEEGCPLERMGEMLGMKQVQLCVSQRFVFAHSVLKIGVEAPHELGSASIVDIPKGSENR